MGNLSNLKNKILSKDDVKESTLFDVWHSMMRAYGWITLDEFLMLDSNHVSKLCKRISKENEINKGGKK